MAWRVFPMEVDREIVEHIALLGRLELSEEEKVRFEKQLSAILGYVEKLRAVPLEGVQPLVHPLELANVFREDEPRAPLPREDALANAPEPEDPFFKVPKVIEAD